MKYISWILLAASLGSLVVGCMLGEHSMMLSYAVIVCLNCMGIG